MCYNRTKVVETRINTGLLAVFDWTQFAQKHKIHSKKRSELSLRFCGCYNLFTLIFDCEKWIGLIGISGNPTVDKKLLIWVQHNGNNLLYVST